MRRLTVLVVVLATTLALAVGGVGAAEHPVAESPEDCEGVEETEIVGCWGGVHYSEDIGVDQSDGLTEAELEAVTNRSMARVEYLRERPFKSAVPVETMTREEFQEDFADGEETAAEAEFNRWNDQVWKALFVVGEDDASADAIDAVFGGAVSGFYSPTQDRVVLVVAEGEELQVSGSTLVHELGHGMQDQYHDLTDPRYSGATQDADLGVEGIVEGEVVYIEERYDEYCAAEWSCIGEPDADDGDSDLPENFNFGVLQTILQPYSDGPVYAEHLIEEGGWEAVNETMADPPQTTSETIHRNPDYETTEIEFENTAEAGWERYPDQGVDGADTVGEASMFVMFWYQSFEYGAPTFDWRAVHIETDVELRTRTYYNYAHSSTDGWAGDELHPYRNDGDAGDDAAEAEQRDGYVWVTEWQTEADAAEFHETYLRMVDHHDAEVREDGVLHVEDGDFRGAYGVEHDGTTVTIVHAPEPAGVFELRPGIELDVPDIEEPETPATDTPTPTEDPNATPAGTDEPETPATVGETPGFGAVAALVALLATGLLARRGRR